MDPQKYFYMHIFLVFFVFFCFFPVTASRCPIPRICPSSCGARAPVSACRPSRRFGICRGWAPGGMCWDGPWRACHGIKCVGTVGGCLGGFLEKQYVQYNMYIYMICNILWCKWCEQFLFLNSGSGWIKTKPRTAANLWNMTKSPKRCHCCNMIDRGFCLLRSGMWNQLPDWDLER